MIPINREDRGGAQEPLCVEQEAGDAVASARSSLRKTEKRKIPFGDLVPQRFGQCEGCFRFIERFILVLPYFRANLGIAHFLQSIEQRSAFPPEIPPRLLRMFSRPDDAPGQVCVLVISQMLKNTAQ